MRRFLTGWFVLLGLVAGCGRAPGKITYGRYTSEFSGLEVVGSGGAPESAGLMPPGWKLENFYGSPVPDEAKDGKNRMVIYQFDADGDGEYESASSEFASELRFTSLKDDGVVWLRVVPVGTDLKDTSLEVIVDAYVEALAGGNYETLQFASHRSATREVRYATKLVQSQPCRLAELECQLATIEIANVDQLKLSPDYRTSKLQVLIARSRFVYRLYGNPYPTYLVAGYSNQPARFESGVSAFHDLLGRVSIKGRRGFGLSAVAPVAAAPPAAAPSAPAPVAVPAPAAPPASPATAPAPVPPPPTLEPAPQAPAPTTAPSRPDPKVGF